MGGKSRLRNWLIQHFPVAGELYIEPFAGKGNVFFKSKQSLDFKTWHINDIDWFLVALFRVNLNDLPEKVDKTDFSIWKNKNDDISKIIEPRITFGGKGYKAGYASCYHEQSTNNHMGYNRVLYKKTCELAQELLSDVKITQLSWEQLEIEKLQPYDFVYCDPPYVGVKASYPNINHEKLVDILNSSCCMWALSGYSNDLYDNNLVYKNKYTKERNSEIKGSNTGKREPVMEILWTNY
jgi:DNA adenine methylase